MASRFCSCVRQIDLNEWDASDTFDDRALASRYVVFNKRCSLLDPSNPGMSLCDRGRNLVQHTRMTASSKKCDSMQALLCCETLGFRASNVAKSVEYVMCLLGFFHIPNDGLTPTVHSQKHLLWWLNTTVVPWTKLQLTDDSSTPEARQAQTSSHQAPWNSVIYPFPSGAIISRAFSAGCCVPSSAHSLLGLDTSCETLPSGRSGWEAVRRSFSNCS